MPQCTCGGQRTTWKSLSLPFIMRDPRNTDSGHQALQHQVPLPTKLSLHFPLSIHGLQNERILDIALTVFIVGTYPVIQLGFQLWGNSYLYCHCKVCNPSHTRVSNSHVRFKDGSQHQLNQFPLHPDCRLHLGNQDI